MSKYIKVDDLQRYCDNQKDHSITPNEFQRMTQYDFGWHTGTPTEEGWYLVAYECVYECKYKGKLEYHTMHIFENELGYKDIRGRGSDDVWKMLAWMPITPYEEKENGR